MVEPRQEESVFNMALAYLKRIDTLLTLCQQAAFSQDMDNWIGYLRGIYREASVKLNDDEKKDILGDPEKQINIVTLTDQFIKEDEANFRNLYFLINNPQLKYLHRKTILFLLDALEVKIREKLQKKGMLLPSKDDPRLAITRR